MDDPFACFGDDSGSDTDSVNQQKSLPNDAAFQKKQELLNRTNERIAAYNSADVTITNVEKETIEIDINALQ